MGDSKRVTVLRIRRTAHDGGYLSYEVDGHTEDGQARRYTFTGNLFVGPVVLGRDGAPAEVVIHHPRRFGEFATEQWVHRFFAEWQDQDVHTEDVAAVTAGCLTTGYQTRCG
ncbi:hypothetical protein ASG82_12825 [Mycobacterium sp. Soil538]|nr:hypothetical protein ASG82_12825 [Mycobacterium sp. Soil538]